MTATLPNPQGGWRGAIGRPIWAEGRASAEVAALLASRVWRGEGVPAGGGRPVVLVPGFLAGASSMQLLDRWLSARGWDVRHAAVGRSAGPSSALAAAVEQTVRSCDAPVVLIGHSRGGQAARVATVRLPERVAALVTLGAPVRTVIPPFLPVRLPIETLRLAARLGLAPRPDPAAERRYALDLTGPFPASVPWLSVWSKTDGVVDWRACLDRAATDRPITASHVGMVGHRAAFEAIATHLDLLDAPQGVVPGPLEVSQQDI
jgi:triacylglycerol lipase